MDEIGTKAIIIGVSIFVTLIIVTVLVFEFTQIQDIYKVTAETNITFEDRLDEFDKYRDSTNYFNGLDVKNTIEKYYNDKTVEVCIKDGEAIDCSDTLTVDTSEYNKEYKAYMVEERTIFQIVFEKE